MNIFISDSDPMIAARNLDDKRLVKMILETAQLLSSAVILNGGKAPYKLTHAKHPCTKWAAETRDNFYWLCSHGFDLSDEYYYRFGKLHKSHDVIYQCRVSGIASIPLGKLLPFPNCTVNKVKGISFKHVEDTVEAYRLYLSARWNTDSRKPKWTKRTKPEWYNDKV